MLKIFSKGLEPGLKHYITLDIGSEYIKALTCELGEKRSANVLGYAKERLSLGDMFSNTVVDISNIIKVSKLCIEKANKMAGVAPTQVIIGIAGDLIHGLTTSLTYKRVDPSAKINESELKNVIHKIQWKAFEQLRAELSHETGFNEIDIKLINAAIIATEIDGYSVANPIGFQGKEIQMTIFNAFSPSVHYGAIQTIAAELNLEILAMTSEPYALSKALIDRQDDSLDTIIIDVGSGTTDIAVIRDNVLVGSKMFTLGGRIFTKRIAQQLNVSYKDAEEIKLSYSNTHLEKRSHQIVTDAIADDAALWLSGVKWSLNSFKNCDALPTNIRICGGGSLLPEIKEQLESRLWSKDLPFSRKPKIRFFTTDDIRTIHGSTDFDASMITPLGLSHTALDFAGDEKLTNKLLKKVTRLVH